jgi:hypothetical protein
LGTTSNQAGDYLCADVNWLRSSLDQLQSKKHLFVFLHISQYKWVQNGVSCPAVTDLLEQTPNVTAVFHGHDHQVDNEMIANGRYYFFDGHLGGSWGTPYYGYRIVEIGQDDKVRSYQCNPEAFVVNSTRV